MYDIISNLWCHDICPSPPPRQERTSCHQAWPPQVCTCNQVKSLVRSIVWDYLRSAMQATNSQTFFGHIIPEKDDGIILKWSLPLDFVGVLSASVPSANLKEHSAYQEFSARFSQLTT